MTLRGARREIHQKLDLDELEVLFGELDFAEDQVLLAIVAAAKNVGLPHPTRGTQDVLRAIIELHRENRKQHDLLSKSESRDRLRKVIVAARALDAALQGLPLGIHSNLRLAYFLETGRIFSLLQTIDFVRTLSVTEFPISAPHGARKRPKVQHEDAFIREVALGFRDMGGVVLLRERHATQFEQFLSAIWKLAWNSPHLFPIEAMLPQKSVSTEDCLMRRARRHSNEWVPRKVGRKLASEVRSFERTTLSTRLF